jgi:hypothetical protein
VKRASNDTLAGRRYLDLQREAKRTGRPTDELIQLYALECFLDRLVHSKFADTFILKGGHRDQIHIPNDGTLTMKVRCRDQKVTTQNWGRVPGFARRFRSLLK